MEKKREYQSESPVVKEVREARRQVWAEHDFDVNRVFDTIAQEQEKEKREGRKFADLKPFIPEDFEERLKAYQLQRK